MAADCEQLAADGIGMLRFDNLGLGDSEGNWERYLARLQRRAPGERVEIAVRIAGP